MQKLLDKLLIFFILLSFSSLQQSHAQDVTSDFAMADNFFEQHEYSKALEKYQAVLDQGRCSAQMLMKMAYIQEGLGNVPQALYYLSLLNNFSPSESTLQKMADIASNYSLEGYGISDEAYFTYLLRKYKQEVWILLAALGCLGLALLIWVQQRKHSIVMPSLSLGIYCLFVVWMVDFQKDVERAIVIENETFVMDAPSAGAGLVSSVKAGHRVSVLDKKDIWYEIEWQGQKAFVRNSNLQVIR